MSQMGNFGVQTPPPVDPRFVHLLTRWDAEVRSLEKQGWEAQKIAQDFAKLALSSALVLNGGALLALPPLMQWLSHDGRTQVAGQAFWFLLGVISATIATMFAYTNWIWIKDEQNTQGTKRARELECDYLRTDVGEDKRHKAAKDRLKWLPRVVNGTAMAGVFFAILAYVFFCTGAYKFMSLAERNALAPASETVTPLKTPASPKKATPPKAATQIQQPAKVEPIELTQPPPIAPAPTETLPPPIPKGASGVPAPPSAKPPAASGKRSTSPAPK